MKTNETKKDLEEQKKEILKKGTGKTIGGNLYV